MLTFRLQITSLGVTWFKKDDDLSRGVQIFFFFLFKRFCRDKGAMQFLMSSDNTSGGLELYQVLESDI